jgi:hypothetical protein
MALSTGPLSSRKTQFRRRRLGPAPRSGGTADDDRLPAHRRLQLRGRPGRGDRAARDRELMPLQPLPASQRSSSVGERPPRTRHISIVATRTGSACGSRTAVARSGSAATAARRYLAAIRPTPIRSAFAWGRSMMIPGFARASASSWRTPRRGSRSQTTGCPATRESPREAIAPLEPRGRKPGSPGPRS